MNAPPTVAQRLAQNRAVRAPDDNRRTCLECRHCPRARLDGWGQCHNGRAAGFAQQRMEVGPQFAALPQRCHGFAEREGPA